MEKTMMAINGTDYEFDDHGFLDPSDQWNEDFAEKMALELGIVGGMTEEHWQVIRYLRKTFLEEGAVPAVFHTCADNRIRLDRMKSLFPMGYVRGACRIAGINFATFADYTLWLSYEHIPVIEASKLGRNPSFSSFSEGRTSPLRTRDRWPAALRGTSN